MKLKKERQQIKDLNETDTNCKKQELDAKSEDEEKSLDSEKKDWEVCLKVSRT